MGIGRKIKIAIIFIILNLCVYSFFIPENVVQANEQNELQQYGTDQLSYANNYQSKEIDKVQVNFDAAEKVSYNSTIVSVEDIAINLYQNEICFLPETVQAKLSDGKVKAVKVDWEDAAVDSVNVGGYSITGTVKGYKKEIKCTIVVKPIEELMNKLVVLPEGEYDKVEAQAIIGRLSKIYPSILNGLVKNNIKIKLITKNITDLPEYAYLKGLIPRGWEGTGKTWDDVPGVCGNPVAVKIGYSETGKGHGSINLELHETAHTIDMYLLKSVTGTKEFKDIWKQETVKLFGDNPYYSSYSDEYFAEFFAMYYLEDCDKYELSMKAPLTTRFLEKLEEGFYINYNKKAS